MADPKYRGDHLALRAEWDPHVASGVVDCHAKECLHPSRRILPGQLWHLGHNDAGTEHTGPEHQLCNVTDGGRRSRSKLAPPAVIASMEW